MLHRKVTHNIGKLHVFLAKKPYFCNTYHKSFYNNFTQSNR